MATFIKLTNGTTISSAVIGSVQSHNYLTARQVVESIYRHNPNKVTDKIEGTPSIKMVDVHGKETIIEFESEEARDVELSRIEGLLIPEVK